MNLLSVLQPTPPEIWKQVSKDIKVKLEDTKPIRQPKTHIYTKGPYQKIDNLILMMEVGKLYSSHELAEIFGQNHKHIHKARTRLLVKFPEEVVAIRNHDARGFMVVFLKRLK